MKTNESFNRPTTRFDCFKEEAMQSLYDGKKMGSTDGVFAPILKHLLESMLQGELNNHLEESKAAGESNRKNGKTKKTVRSLQSGNLEIESTSDRLRTFEPKILPKRQLIVTEELEDKVIAMYARGMSTRNISEFIKEMYAMEISATEISHITDKPDRRVVIPLMNEWRNRPLEAVYPFVFLDCMHRRTTPYKVRDNGSVESRAIYNILGINREGKIELIGISFSENESAKFCEAARRLSVLTD